MLKLGVLFLFLYNISVRWQYARSKAIIYENHKLLKSPKVLHKVTKANLKKPCATTYRVSDLNKKKYYLEAIVQDFDFF